MTSETSDLADFGWNQFFAAQLDLDDPSAGIPARVVAVHSNDLQVAAPGLDRLVPPFGTGEGAATVGDWLLLDAASSRPLRLLRRRSLFKRRAAGTGRAVQLLAANVDTLFIVSSCNQDFNVARLERYLVLASEAEVTPVVVLTKPDLATVPEDYARAAAKLMPGLVVEILDARDPASVARLEPWCARGQTVALLGSSGVGKSTLVNTLTGNARIATQGIREDDDKGRHTTSGRALHRLPAGGWLLDTPGMRELQLTDAKAGLDGVFADIVDLAGQCRFNDCRHTNEPGCAVQAAIGAGVLDAGRFERWAKLAAEDSHNSASLVARRARSRSFGRMAKRAQRDKQSRQGE